MNEVENVDGHTKQVHIARPERYWMANKELLPAIIDPDVDDGHQRWADRDDIRWSEIGRLLTGVSIALGNGSYAESHLFNDAIEISTTAPADGLTLSETKILESWFNFAEAPRSDLWDNGLVNGRHRLWNVWKHAPAAILPIRSNVLDDADGMDSMEESFAAIIRDTAATGVTGLPIEVITRSPLYISALALLATSF